MEGDVSKSWTKELQKKYCSLVKSSPLSSDKILEAHHRVLSIQTFEMHDELLL
jgi:hypothetical protein